MQASMPLQRPASIRPPAMRPGGTPPPSEVEVGQRTQMSSTVSHAFSKGLSGTSTLVFFARAV